MWKMAVVRNVAHDEQVRSEVGALLPDSIMDNFWTTSLQKIYIYLMPLFQSHNLHVDLGRLYFISQLSKADHGRPSRQCFM